MCWKREKGGDIRAPISRFLRVKLGLFVVLVGTKRGGWPAMESLGTEVRGEGEHRLHYRK